MPHIVPIYFSGHETKLGKLEATAIATVRKFLPVILGEHARKIKAVNIVSIKGEISDWRNGFSRLWQDSEITIVIPKNYRTWYRTRLVVVHELLHVRQILRGELKHSPKLSHIDFKGKRYFLKEMVNNWPKFWVGPDDKVKEAAKTPWERTIILETDRLLGHQNYYNRRKIVEG